MTIAIKLTTITSKCNTIKGNHPPPPAAPPATEGTNDVKVKCDSIVSKSTSIVDVLLGQVTSTVNGAAGDISQRLDHIDIALDDIAEITNVDVLDYSTKRYTLLENMYQGLLFDQVILDLQSIIDDAPVEGEAETRLTTIDGNLSTLTTDVDTAITRLASGTTLMSDILNIIIWSSLYVNYDQTLLDTLGEFHTGALAALNSSVANVITKIETLRAIPTPDNEIQAALQSQLVADQGIVATLVTVRANLGTSITELS